MGEFAGVSECFAHTLLPCVVHGDCFVALGAGVTQANDCFQKSANHSLGILNTNFKLLPATSV
ncbi:hypothetical protein [Helicobacter pullorum]|uniref:hypothetical protein n=1 Tax=Helicobacter pullorum TaxID=35818 RepID=UPI00117BB2A7|nr:hypothetical protein [Helicobacter pullorum]